VLFAAHARVTPEICACGSCSRAESVRRGAAEVPRVDRDERGGGERPTLRRGSEETNDADAKWPTDPNPNVYGFQKSLRFSNSSFFATAWPLM